MGEVKSNFKWGHVQNKTEKSHFESRGHFSLDLAALELFCLFYTRKRKEVQRSGTKQKDIFTHTFALRENSEMPRQTTLH